MCGFYQWATLYTDPHIPEDPWDSLPSCKDSSESPYKSSASPQPVHRTPQDSSGFLRNAWVNVKCSLYSICHCKSILELRAQILVHANTASRNYTYKGQCNRCSPYSQAPAAYSLIHDSQKNQIDCGNDVSNCNGFADPVDHATIENIVM
jgi:hypothetical protein